MRSHFECVPCFLRQALEGVRMITSDEAVHEKVLREVLSLMGHMDFDMSPPVMGQQIHRVIKRETKQSDPYKEQKERSNWLVQKMYPWMCSYVADAKNSREAVLQLAIAGNIIDLGVYNKVDESDIHKSIEKALQTPLEGNEKEFFQAVAKAKKILYLADNAGEIVFDKLLLEQMPLEKVIVAVRGFPIINDATLIDAEAVGLTRLVKVIDNGSDAPGTVLADCSSEFRNEFQRADLIVAKGQGNYETLSDEVKDIFFLFKAKCPVIAQHAGCLLDTLVLSRSAANKNLKAIVA
jgi:damage-control phosphatase, subfamily I